MTRDWLYTGTLIRQVQKLMIVGSGFPLLEKGATYMGREKNPVLLEWNWEYGCELMVFNND